MTNQPRGKRTPAKSAEGLSEGKFKSGEILFNVTSVNFNGQSGSQELSDIDD